MGRQCIVHIRTESQPPGDGGLEHTDSEPQLLLISSEYFCLMHLMMICKTMRSYAVLLRVRLMKPSQTKTHWNISRTPIITLKYGNMRYVVTMGALCTDLAQRLINVNIYICICLSLATRVEHLHKTSLTDKMRRGYLCSANEHINLV